MEKNDFLMASEVIYQIHACESMHDLKNDLYYQLNMLIPFRYASYIAVERSEATGKLRHEVLFCKPERLAAAERAWLKHMDQDAVHTQWLSSARECVVIRDSDLLEGNRRFSKHSYQEIFRDFDIYDAMQMNVIDGGKTVGRLTLYRTREDGPFHEQDAFLLRTLSKHINLAFARCSRGQSPDQAELRRSALAQRSGLTKREEEVLGCMFRGMDNGDICDRLKISRNTLYKHNNSIFRKCGVKSRLELLKLE